MPKALKITLISLVAIATLGVVAAAGILFYFSRDLPDIRAFTLADYRPNIITDVYGANGEIIDQFYVERREVVPPERIPLVVRKAFIAAEDASFYEHRGIDPAGIVRAAIKNVQAGRVVQGASTITQQVCKSLFLTNERSFRRKIREAILAVRLEKRLSKEQILYLYLNEIYLGGGNYGVQAAARDFFAKSVEELSLGEAAMLAGLPKAPSEYSPHRNLSKALWRQRYVLQRMIDEGFVTQSEADEAQSQKIEIVKAGTGVERIAPYFTEEVRQEILARYGYDALFKEGLKIYTTLDPRLQRAANEAVRKGLVDLDKRQGYHGVAAHLEPADFAGWIEETDRALAEAPLEVGQEGLALVRKVEGARGLDLAFGTHTAFVGAEAIKWTRTDPDNPWSLKRLEDVFRVGDLVAVRVAAVPGETAGERATPGGLALELYQEPEVQGALVAMHPLTGEITALVGGYDFERSQFNRATQAVRQPGSAFKPIIYAAAMEGAFTPASIVIDAPIIYDDPGLNEVWKPQNFGRKFHGPTTIRDALTHSRNVVTIKVLRELGPQAAIDEARRLGISTTLEPNLSLALGSYGVKPIELGGAFAVFAAGGRRAIPYMIERVESRTGEVLEVAEPTTVEAISPQVAYLMTNLLTGVVNDGTGRKARVLGRPLAGKTGTTNESQDAWFVGFSPDLVVTSWVGFDKDRTLNARETGGRAALPIWIDFMRVALDGTPIKPFAVPDKIVFRRIDADSGLLPGNGTKRTIVEAFIEGTEPVERTGWRGSAWRPADGIATTGTRMLFGEPE